MDKKNKQQLDSIMRARKLEKLDGKLLNAAENFTETKCWLKIYEDIYKPVQDLIGRPMSYAIRIKSRKQIEDSLS
jgi:hypothetical protein